MEVHHHAHTARKKWTHYFWEFLMLFLAVTAGFLVENKREHYIEHIRARQYASTMVEDLKADQEALVSGISINGRIIKKITTLLFLYDPENKQTKTTGQLYYYGRHGIQFWQYVYKQVTLEQMKHSGTIRYFQNSFLEKKMVALDKDISFIQYWDNKETFFREQALQYATSLFNYTVLQRIPADTTMLEINEAPANPVEQPGSFITDFLHSNPPLTNDKLINEFLNFCNLRLHILNAKINAYTKALNSIETLMADLKKEYNLK